MAETSSQIMPDNARHNIYRSTSLDGNAPLTSKITYKAGPDKKKRAKYNQFQSNQHDDARCTYQRPSLKPNISGIPMTYIQYHTLQNKRLAHKSLIKQQLQNLYVQIKMLYKNKFNEHIDHNFYIKKPTQLQNKQTDKTEMATSTASKKSPNHTLQSMLQKGIDGYMREKNPSKTNKRVTRSSTKTNAGAVSASDASSTNSTPTKNNKTKATEIPLPSSDDESSEAEKERLLQEEAKEQEEALALAKANLTEEEKRMDAEDDAIMNEIDGMNETYNEEKNDEDGTKLTDEMENEHSAQSKLNKKLTTATPEERMNMIRQKAKEKAAEKLREINQAKQSKKANEKPTSKKQKRKESKKKKKEDKKQTAAAALKTAEDAATKDANNDAENKETETIIQDEIEISDDDDIEEVSSSDDELAIHGVANPYSILAQETRKKKSAKQEKKRLKALKRPFNTYYTLKIKVEEHANPAVALMDAASTWLNAIQTVDPNVVVYGYRDVTPTYGIFRSSDMPKGLMSFKEFFVGANPRSDAGHVWANIWIGHALEPADLFSNFKRWLRKNDTYMYLKKLQEKNTVRDYFLLWSTTAMSEDTLVDATHSALAMVTKEKYKFAFPWSVIRKEDNRYVNNEVPGSMGRQYVRAMHIEVPKETAEQTYRALNQFFGSNSRINILHRRLRMVPVLRQSNTARTKAKINQLIAMQKSYNDRLETATTYDLRNIDIVRADVGVSLRQIIMELRTLDGTDELIFTSIDYDTYTEHHKLTFPTMLKSQAWDYITQLPSFLHWVYGDPILKLLTDAAVERALDAPWSEEDMCTISKQDIELDTYAADAQGISWMQDVLQEDVEEIAIEDTETVRKNEAFLFRRTTDDDSISTFNNRKGPRTETDSDAIPTNTSPTKKLRVDSVATKDVNMDSANGTKQIHNLEILLEDKDSEIMNLRKRLDALTASRAESNGNDEHISTPSSTDRLPESSIGETPGPNEDPGGDL